MKKTKRYSEDIGDDEIRIIVSPDGNRKKSRIALFCILGGLIVLAVAVALLLRIHGGKQDEPDVVAVVPETDTVPSGSLLTLADDIDSLMSYTECVRDTVNDVAMSIFIPHCAVPKLCIGTPSADEKSIILLAQAADVRGDNGEINCSFVLEGELLSKGNAKKGWCSIINGRIELGCDEDSPNMEKAIATGGYFFRQYPLVFEGTVYDNVPKGKAVRRALCSDGKHDFIVATDSRESFHDFAFALYDLGVRRAIYLIGATSYGYYRDSDGNMQIIHEREETGYEKVNYIVWEK